MPFSCLDYDGHFIDNIVDESIDIEKVVEFSVQVEELKKALNRLTKEEKNLIISIFYREESLKIISEREHISYQAVGKKRDKILKKLRQLLSER